MRALDGTQTLVRIFIGDSDRLGHAPLEHALLERLRKEGFAGATVLRGVAGFGASSVLHTARLLELSSDLPIIIEVVDDETHVERLFVILDELLADAGAFVTAESVRVVKYAPRAASKR